MTTQSLAGVLDSLLSSFEPLYAAQVGPDLAPVLVSFGPPGEYQPSAIVMIGDTKAKVSRPTLGPNRSREIEATVALTYSVYTPGDESAQQVSLDSALSLVVVLEQNLRALPNERLGGVCRDAWLSQIDPSGQVAVDPETGAPAGRVATVDVVLTALIRY